MRARVALLAAVVLVAAACVSGCGGSDDSDDSGKSGSSAATQDQQGSSSSAGGGKPDGPDQEDSAPVLSGDPEQAREGLTAVEDVYEGFDAAVEAGVSATDVAVRDTLDAAASNESLTKVCDLMSEKAQEQTIHYAKVSAGLADVKWNCENATGLLLRRGRQTGGLKRSLRAEIVGVNVEGNRATASVRFGGKRAISSISLIKEDGEWKLGPTPTGPSADPKL